MEVRVKASANQIIQEPSFCIEKKKVCAIKAQGTAFHLNQNQTKWHLSNNSSVVRQDKQNIKFVEGSLWIEKSNSEFKVTTVFADVVSEDGGGFWVYEKNGKIWVRNMDGIVKLNLRGGVALEVPEGFEIWIGAVDHNGVTSHGVVQAINMNEIGKDLLKIYSGSKHEFIEALTYYRDRWGDLNQRSTVLYKDVVVRELASIEKNILAEENKKKSKLEEKEKLRQLYLQKSLGR